MTFCYPVMLFAGATILVQGSLNGLGLLFLASRLAHFFVLITLAAVQSKTRRLDGYHGYVVMASFFLSHSLIHQSDDFAEAVYHYILGICFSNLFTVFVNASWILSALLHAALGFVYWKAHAHT